MWVGCVFPCSSLFDAFFYFLEEEEISGHGRDTATRRDQIRTR